MEWHRCHVILRSNLRSDNAVISGDFQVPPALLSLTAMKKKASPDSTSPSSSSRPTKKAKKTGFRLAKDPESKPVIATTVRQRNSSGQLGVKRANAAHIPHQR